MTGDLVAIGRARAAKLREMAAVEDKKKWKVGAVLRENASLIDDLTLHAEELERALEQACRDLHQAHDELMRAQGAEHPERHDWPVWSPQANTLRWARKLLRKPGPGEQPAHVSGSELPKSSPVSLSVQEGQGEP